MVMILIEPALESIALCMNALRYPIRTLTSRLLIISNQSVCLSQCIIAAVSYCNSEPAFCFP